MGLEDKDLIKHSAAVHIANNITLIQRKVWNVLLANAYQDLPHQEIFQVSVKDLMRVLGLQGSHNVEHVKKSVESLAKYTIRWNVLGKAPEDEDWGFMYFLAEARIRKGVLSYAYPPTLRKLLHNPRWYAKIKLSMQSKFSTKYGLALFEICVDAYMRKAGRGTTHWMDIQVFRELMGLNGEDRSEDKYRDFKDLNKCVIKPALSEVNKAESFAVTVHFKRENKKVVAIRFDIRECEGKPKALPPADPPRFSAMFDQALFRELQDDFCLSQSDALAVLTKHDAGYIRGNLDVVRKRYKAGKITENLPGYALKAIEKDYRPKRSGLDREEALRREGEAAGAMSKETVLRLEQEYGKAVKAEAARLLGSLSEKRKREQVSLFEESLSPALSGLYQNRGLESPLFKLRFKVFLVERLGSAGLRNLAAFAEARGIRLVKNSRDEYEVAAEGSQKEP